MSKPFGASTQTWLYWDVVLGLGADLLPVVCEPNLPISPSSQLTAYGKVPSRFDRQGRVVGFPQWTSHVTSDAELETWAADDRLGICLQTRMVRAIDVDIEDVAIAAIVYAAIANLGYRLPCRSRANSAKFLLLFEADGLYSKQVLQTAGGAIEFLATGQQCVVAGTHPSGARYEWEGGERAITIPRLDEMDVDYLLYTLEKTFSEERTWSAGRSSARRKAGVVEPGIEDSVVEYLVRKGLALHVTPERVDVTCPWAAEHTAGSDASATSYLPAGTGSFETGNFRCLHAHCLGRTIGDFLEAIGWMSDGFVDERTAADAAGPEAFGVEGGSAVVPNPLELPRYERQPKTSKIKPHVNNFLLFIQWLGSNGEGIRFDVFRDEILLTTPRGERPFTDADYTRLQVRAEHGPLGFAPLTMDVVRRIIHMVAQDHCFDSAQERLATLPEWDRVPRVDTFCSAYLGSLHNPYTVAVGRYLWSAMAGRILTPGIQADMAVILVSGQGTGKSTAIRNTSLMPDHYIDLSLSDKDADLARLTRGKSLVELSELRGLHNKEMDSIKSFVTRLNSEWIPKFFEMRTTYHRRFLMMGTTNNDEFLGDVTGERRWLPVRVGQQDCDAIERDHDQLWAEGRALFLERGILWRDAQTLATSEHAEFSTHDVLVDQIQRWLGQEQFGSPVIEKEFLLLLDVMRDGLGMLTRECTRPNQMRVADALRRLGFKTVQKWVDGVNSKVWVRIPSPDGQVAREVDRDFF